MPDRRAARSQGQTGLEPYAGRWVAMVGERVVGQGGTPEQARLAAQATRYKEFPKVIYVPTTIPLEFPPVLQNVADVLPPDLPVYLVGGAVRDVLLRRKLHDLDFVLPDNAVKTSRQIANRLGAAFFPLDNENDTGRVILISPDGGRFTLDFAARRGPDLESDLRGRDFTVNAMAVDVRQPQAVLDPLGGASDLLAKQLRACSPQSFTNDPVRILRGIRQAAGLGFHIVPETRAWMKEAAPLIPRVSPERQRDELFRLLDGPRVPASIQALELLGALHYVLPELETLKGVEQSPPHHEDVWRHTLDVVRHLNDVLAALAPEYDPAKASSLSRGMLVLKLGRYRQQIGEHFAELLNADRPLRPLLFLAALYHDIGKPETRQVGADGTAHFYGHDEAGETIARRRGHALHLSNPELDRLALIIRGHLRPLLLEKDGAVPTRKAIYRFFRAFNAAGVDICLLALADFLGTYGTALPQEQWEHHLDVTRSLLEAWWEHPSQQVAPPSLVNGHDVMKTFDLPPGPRIGEILEAIREAQAVGQVVTRQDAIDLAKKIISS